MVGRKALEKEEGSPTFGKKFQGVKESMLREETEERKRKVMLLLKIQKCGETYDPTWLLHISYCTRGTNSGKEQVQ